VEIRTKIGTASSDQILFHGLDLCEQIMGTMDLGSYAYLCATGRPAGEGEARLITAIMLQGADHGLTASSIAARLVFLGAPEASQAAVAAGLLGAGSRFLGPSELVGSMLRRLSPRVPAEGLGAVASDEVRRVLDLGEKLPGFGHPIHRPVDPRSSKLFELAREAGYYRENCELVEAIHVALTEALGRPVTLNAAAACGAILCDMGIEPVMMRLLIVAARAIGLIAHIREELERPLASDIWQNIMQSTVYD
jgi:citrate synthase